MPQKKLAILGGTPVRSKPYPPTNSLGKEEKKAALKVMDERVISDFLGRPGKKFLGGKHVQEFEAMMCKMFKVKYAVSFNSASTALQAAVAALGIGPGDEVITSPYTMAATATAILLNNAIPVFADVDMNTFCLDAASVEKNITPRTKAILTVNLYGGPTDFDKLLPVAKKHNLKIIEDNAQSIGAKYRGKFLGTVGDIGVFSFNVHKNLQCGEGGVLVTNDKKLAFRAQLVRNHGEAVVDALYDEDGKTYEAIAGNNLRLSELHAAVAVEQLKKMDKLMKPCVELAEYLSSKMKQFSWLEPPKLLKNTTHAYYVFPFKFHKDAIGISRATFERAVLAENLPIHAGYVKPIYLMQIFQRREIFPNTKFPFESKEFPTSVSYEEGICPQVEYLEKEEMMFTTICHPPQTRKDIDVLVDVFARIESQVEDLKKYELKKKAKK